MAREIVTASVLDAPAEAVWQRVVTMEGVNDELGPWIRMSLPPEARGRTIADVPIGDVAFVSVVTLGGLVPIDRHALRLIAVVDGRSFHEESATLLQRRWTHRREVVPLDERTCRLEDRVSFDPRLPVGLFVRPIVRAVFAHRHRRLRERFGGRPS